MLSYISDEFRKALQGRRIHWQPVMTPTDNCSDEVSFHLMFLDDYSVLLFSDFQYSGGCLEVYTPEEFLKEYNNLYSKYYFTIPDIDLDVFVEKRCSK